MPRLAMRLLSLAGVDRHSDRVCIHRMTRSDAAMRNDRAATLIARGHDLLEAYKRAVNAAESTGPLAKAEVTRSILDSGRAVVARLRTRESGVDDLIREFESYIAALHPEDLVAKGWNASQGAYAIAAAALGGGAILGFAGGLVLEFVLFLVEAGQQIGATMATIATGLTGGMVYLILRGASNAYEEYQRSQNGPPSLSAAAQILRDSVDPAEVAFYQVAGGSRPVRTFEAANTGLNVVAYGVLGLLGGAIAYGFVGAMS